MQDDIDFRPYSVPRQSHKRQRPRVRDSIIFKLLTFGVMIFAILWIIGVGVGFHPSKLTFVGFLACLIFYAGEYICWQRPRRPPRQPRPPQPRKPTRAERVMRWKDVT